MAKPSEADAGASVGFGALLTRIPTIDDVLHDHAMLLRDDFVGYRNHVYRVVNLCVAIVGRSELEKIAVAAVFPEKVHLIGSSQACRLMGAVENLQGIKLSLILAVANREAVTLHIDYLIQRPAEDLAG